jgi:RNA polymerase sigma factor (sigma-70 family)
MYSIIEKHYKNGYKQFVKLATYKLNTREDGEDAVQEAYARALKYSRSFEMGEHFNHWFIKILRNVIKDAISEKYGRAHLEELNEEIVEGNADSFYNKKLMEIVNEQLNCVKNEDHREVLELYFMYGFQFREIKEMSPLKINNIKLIVKNFKKELRIRE